MRLVLITALIVAISCGSNPTVSKPQIKNDNDKEETTAQQAEDVFDPDKISQELYASTRNNVQQFIDGLNEVIRNKNYNAWKAVLSPEKFEEMSSTEFLNQASEDMRTRIRTIQEYFEKVVVPSRAGTRVDYLEVDIKFISRNRVTAYALVKANDGSIRRQVLYDLEQIDNLWKIIK